MAARLALMVAVLIGPGRAWAADPFDGCTVALAGTTTRLDCGPVSLTVAEGAETDLTTRLNAHLAGQDAQTPGLVVHEQTALQSADGLLPAARTQVTPPGAKAPAEAWLTAAAPSSVGSVVVACQATVIGPQTAELCDAQVRRVATSGLPAPLRGLVGSTGGAWGAVEAKVGQPVPGVVGCEVQARGSSLVHLCAEGVLAVALIPSPRQGGEVWQQQFLDGVLGGLPEGRSPGIEDSVPCVLGGVETACKRVRVTDPDGDASWVISAGAQGVGSYYTAVCATPDLAATLPLYCRSLFGEQTPRPPAAESEGRRRRSER